MFEYLGEILRDVTVIEFLMRCGIARKEDDIRKLPQPPYIKGQVYKEYPRSFSYQSFDEIVEDFNKYFPKFAIPQDFIDLRHALAHGLTTEVNNDGITRQIKFKESKKTKELKIEFSLPLELPRLMQIRQSVHEIKSYIMKEIDDSNWQ